MSARRTALGGVFVLAEACLIVPMLVLLPTPLQQLSRPALLGATWLTLCAISGGRRVLAARDASVAVQRAISGLSLAGVFLGLMIWDAAGMGAEALGAVRMVVLFTAATLVWWRGTSVSQAEFMPAEVQQRLRGGLVLFAMYAIVNLLNPAYDLLPFLLPFLFSALLALPLSYLERVEQSATGQHVAMTWPWWRAILFSTGAAMAVSTGVMAVFTPEILQRALLLIVGAILLPLALILGLLLEPLINLVRSLLNRPEQAAQPLTDLTGLQQQLQQQPEHVANPIILSDHVVFALVLILLFTVMVLMILTTARARRQPIRVRQGGDEEGPFAPDAKLPESPSPLARTLDLRRWLAGVTVRRLYARMTHEAAKRGATRLPAQTPYDYLPQLGGAFPGADAEVRLITDAYVAAHYGQVPDTDEELAEIRAAWERARRTQHSPIVKAQEGA